jgi:hypothetical protein
MDGTDTSDIDDAVVGDKELASKKLFFICDPTPYVLDVFVVYVSEEIPAIGV